MTTVYSTTSAFNTVTSWIALTTQSDFSESIQTECSTAIYSQQGTAGVLIAFDPFWGRAIGPALSCLPAQASIIWDQTSTQGTTTQLGPLECPSMYYTATTSLVNLETTAIACCPSQYAFQSFVAIATVGECISPITSGQSFYYAESVGTTWIWTTSIADDNVNVYGIPVNGYNFAASTTTTTSSPSSATTNSLTTGPTNTSAFPSSSTPTATGSTNAGLSPGAKAGIGVGVSLGILGLISLIAAIFLLRRRRPKKETAFNNATELPSPPENPHPTYKFASELKATAPLSEMDSGNHTVHEMDA